MSQTNTFISDKQVSVRYEVSRATIWRWVKEGNFPSPVKFTTGCTRWRLSDLQTWEASKEA